MILYEPTKKIAGLFHLTVPLDVSFATPLWKMVHEDILGLLFAMQRNGLAFEDQKTLVANLIGGQNSEDLLSLLPVAESSLKHLGVSRISIEEGVIGQVKHIAFDARDGKTYNLKNLLPRKVSDFDMFAFPRCEATNHMRHLTDVHCVKLFKTIASFAHDVVDVIR